ncbi:Protein DETOXIFICATION 29 [Glycine soja]
MRHSESILQPFLYSPLLSSPVHIPRSRPLLSSHVHMPRSRRSNPRLAERVFSATKTGRLDYLVNLYMHSLSSRGAEDAQLAGTAILREPHQIQPQLGSTAVFIAGTPDIAPITSTGDFYREFMVESKKLGYLAGPAIFSFVSKYSLGAFTQIFAGHVGTIDLAAVSVENSLIAGFSYGIMLGMGSALETLCGQAVGAGKLDMLGVYMQRSWVLLLSMAFVLWPMYIFAGQVLKFIGQDTQISETAGTFAIWMIPQLFAYAQNFPVAKFLQAQVLSWLLMVKLELGLVGAAVVLNGSWWFVVVAQLVYVFGGWCWPAWNGFSGEAFRNLCGFFRLSLASAVMLCMNILGWTIMVSFRMNAATRISNELGVRHPRATLFSLVVAVITSVLIGILLAIVLMILRNEYPSLFSNDTEVQDLVKNLTPFLCFCIVINNVQSVLSGVAIGAGWQALVAYVNIACYYLFGIPVGLVLGYKLDWGVKGIWLGMIAGTILQTCVLLVLIYKTNWNEEASLAEDRIRTWGGHEKATVKDTKNTKEET